MSPPAPSPPPIRRRFLQVGGRRVHYLRAGDGPPAIMVHSSPANASFLLPEIRRLATAYTVFAFDTPGFGLSQPLPLATMTVADLADALSETLRAIEMPPCPVFGSHSGAAIALELGVRHPQRVTGLVLDGVPAFTTEECEALFGDYFRKLPVSDLGGHYAEVWTRFRDQSVWFPWSQREPGHLNDYDLGPPENTHLWVSMYFDAADSYAPAYRATSHYGARAIAAAAELTRPTIYTATETDMLFPHLARLPPMKAGQEIRQIGRSYEAKRDLIGEGFARFGSPGRAPDDRDALVGSRDVSRRFLDGEALGQIHLRYAGDPADRAILLIHDAPGSAAAFEPLIAALSRDRFVIAPDLPGSGESDPLDIDTPGVADFASAVRGVTQQMGVEACDVYGLGFGASVAVELARSAPGAVRDLTLGGLFCAQGPARAELAARYTPPIPIEADGSHWYRTWLMLRDSLVWWPWYDRRVAALRRTSADFGAQALHRWTLEVMRRRDSYGSLVQAVFAHDAISALLEVRAPLRRLIGADTPLAVFDADLAEQIPQAEAHPFTAGFDALAAILATPIARPAMRGSPNPATRSTLVKGPTP